MKRNTCMLMLLMATAIHIRAVESYTKRWIHTNLWNDPTNWQPPQLPCLQGSVQMQDGTVFISNETALPSQIFLASDGKLVFARDSIIKLGPPSSNVNKREECEQSVFLGDQQRSWDNPLNWVVIDDNRPVPKTLTDAVPYVERIPCENDDVKFPEHKVFSVQIGETAHAHSVILGGKTISTNKDMQIYLTTDDGQENFVLADAAQFHISSGGCSKEGCLCRQNREKICGSFTCPSLSCERKVTPVDDCCSHCGAIIEFEFEKGFVRESCAKAVKNETDRVGVEAYVSRISTTTIEILFTDGSDGAKAEELMKQVGRSIQKPGHACATKKVVEKTFKDYMKADKTEGGADPTMVTLGIIIPLIVIIMLIICLAIYFHRKRRGGQFKPERFDDKEVSEYPGFNEVVTTDFMSPDYQSYPVSANKESSQAFSNPCFSSNQLETEVEPDFTNSHLNIGMGNPLYSELNKKVEKEYEADNSEAKPIPQKAINETAHDKPETKGPEKVHVKNNKSGFTNPLYDDVYEAFDEWEDNNKKEEGEEPSPFKEYDDSGVANLGQYKTLYDEDEFK